MIINQYLLDMQRAEMQKAMAQRNILPQSVKRRMTVSTTATPVGACCNYFDRCGDGDLMSLHFEGTLPLLDWMGFNISRECTKTFEFLTYLRSARSVGDATVGYLADPCEDPSGWEFGTCKLTIDDFGRYGRLGPTRDVMKTDLKYCITDPTYRLDGTPVTDEQEWDMVMTTDQIIQDINKDIVVGNATNAGQMDGLEQIVSTGYDCAPLDSIVVDWNGNPMSGGAGITWNGTAIANTYDFVDVLLAVFRRIRQRINMAPRLRNQQMNLGDMILVMPTNWAQCLLDFYTCWGICPTTSDMTAFLGTLEGRTKRDSLLGGLFGAGTIYLDTVPIPIMTYDYELIKGPDVCRLWPFDQFIVVGHDRDRHGVQINCPRPKQAAKQGIPLGAPF